MNPKNLLSQHGYIVKVQALNDLSCTSTFPRLDPISQQGNIIYEVRQDGLIIDNEFLVVPTYVLRLLINFDIIHRAKRLHIHEDLLTYYNREGKEVEDIREVIQPPNVDVVNEGFLYRLFVHAAADNFPTVYEDVAISHGVQVGYRLLKGFF